MKVEEHEPLAYRSVEVEGDDDLGDYTPDISVFGPDEFGNIFVREWDAAGNETSFTLTRNAAAALVLLLTTVLAEGK